MLQNLFALFYPNWQAYLAFVWRIQWIIEVLKFYFFQGNITKSDYPDCVLRIAIPVTELKLMLTKYNDYNYVFFHKVPTLRVNLWYGVSLFLDILTSLEICMQNTTASFSWGVQHHFFNYMPRKLSMILCKAFFNIQTMTLYLQA